MEILLPILLLAVASDSEDGNEETWVERFDQIDADRNHYGVPLLSARERMSMILGKPDPNPDWIVGVVWDYGIHAMALCLYRLVNEEFPTAVRWKLACVLGKYVHNNYGEEDRALLDRDAGQWGRKLHLGINLQARDSSEWFLSFWAFKTDHLK
jgi:hypothetical protein